MNIKKNAGASGIIYALLFACLVIFCAAAAASPADFFPLQKGNQWVYDARIRYLPAGASEVREENLEWTMEVLETLQRDFVRGALILGHPKDLIWYSEETIRRKYLVFNLNDEKYYLIQGERVPEIWKSFQDGNMPLDAVTESDLIVEMPLQERRMFGETAMLMRGDGLNVWMVEGTRPADKADSRKWRVDAQTPLYRITYRCLPEHFFVDYLPGVGIEHYVYGHHGTVSEVDAKLVEFFPAPSP